MSEKNFQLAVNNVLELEGGLVDHRHDPGGITNFGISLRFLKQITDDTSNDVNNDGIVDGKDIKSLTPTKAKQFYHKYWWVRYNYDRIDNPGIAIKILDMSVNMGGRQAHKLVQRACRAVGTCLTDDGILGDKSFEAINLASPKLLIPALRCTQAGFYYSLVLRNAALRKAGVKKNKKDYEDFSIFLEGWLNRAYK